MKASHYAFIFILNASSLVPNFREERPSWEANSSASHSRNSLRFMYQVHYHVQNSPPLDPIQSQNNPVQASPSCFFKIHFNIFLPSMSRSSSGLLPWGFPTKTLNAFLFCPYMPQVSHLVLLHLYHPNSIKLNLPHTIGRGVRIMKLLTVQFYTVSC